MDRVTSTQDVARRLAREGAPAGTVVTAREQTAGRGRLGRAWHSPPGRGLYLSLVLPALPGPDAACLSLVMGAAVREALLGAVPWPRSPLLRWPNDVVMPDGRKLAGLLLEMESGGARPVAVLGVGVNVSHRPSDLPATSAPGGASILMASGVAPDLDALAAAVVARALAGVARFLREGFGPLREEIVAASWPGVGARVVVVDGGVERMGTWAGIDVTGALLVRDDAGAMQRLHAGDVRVRAAQLPSKGPTLA